MVREDFIYFDVDETIILHQDKKYKKLKKIKIRDPYDPTLVHTVSIHKSHVYWLKIMARRGSKIVVWSAGGRPWAQAVVDALGLNEFVSFCLGKPNAIYDDEPVVLKCIPRWDKPY